MSMAVAYFSEIVLVCRYEAFNFFYLDLLAPRLLDAIWSVSDEDEAASKYPDIKAAIANMARKGVKDPLSPSSSRNTQVFCIMKFGLSQLTRFCVLDSPQIEQFEELVVRATESSALAARLRLRGDFYLLFLREFVRHSVYLTRSATEWALVPGYYQIIHPFLVQMKECAPRYPYKIVEVRELHCSRYERTNEPTHSLAHALALKTATILLHNVDLFNIYIEISLKATNAHIVEDCICTANSHELTHKLTCGQRCTSD